MIILALDLTSRFGSLALRVDGMTKASMELHSIEGFGHLVFPSLQSFLENAGIEIDRVDCFAAASGPGAFTGVRVGLSAIKGLAEALNKPAAGISNLRALSTFGQGENRAVVLDARRGDIFGAVYNRALQPVGSEVVATLSDWLHRLPADSYEFIFQAGFSPALDETKFAGMPRIEAPLHLAEAIAICAERDGAQGKWSDPAALDANYVRRSDAEMFWSEI